MNFIKKFFLDWKVRQAVREQKHTKRLTPNYDESMQIGILIETANPNVVEAVQKFVQKITKDGKKVSIIGYLPANTSALEWNFQCHTFSEKEIDNWGNIRLEVIETFIQQPFDYLYCLSTANEQPLRYILAKSRAKCRVGRYAPENAQFFEMMIDLKPNEDLDILTQQALHYTKSIIYN